MLKQIAAVLSAACAVTAAVQVTAQETTAKEAVAMPPSSTAEAFINQPLTAKLSNRPGLTLASPLAEISFFSSVMAIEPPWRTVRFYSENHGKAADKINLPDGGYQVKLLQANDTNEFKLNDYSCTVNGSTAKVILDCEAAADIPNVFEYSALAIPYTLLKGAVYSAELEDGTKVENKKLSASEPNVVMPLLSNVRKIEFKTTLGDLIIEVKQGPCFNLVDRRGVSFGGKKCFWLGYQTTLDYGKPFKSEIDVTFNTAKDLVLATPLAATVNGDLPVATVENAGKLFRPDLELLPVPKQITQPLPGDGGKFAVIDNEITVCVANMPQAELPRFAAACERVFGKMNIESEVLGRDARIAHAVRVNLDADKVKNPEGYELNVTPQEINITAATPRGAFYALQTLRNLYRDGGFPEVTIVDEPDMELRAAFLLVDDYSKIFHTNLVNDVLAPMKYNAVVIECEYVQWDATKDVHEPWGMSKPDYINFVKYCADNYIDVIPLFQTFGHSGWLFPKQADGSFKNVDWAEDPRFPYAYNVSAPGLYEYIEKVLDEVIEASGNPKYLHIGHDEVFHPEAEFPYRPENKAKGAKKILYDDIMWYHAYGQKKGLQIMLWHDLLVTKEESAENGSGGEPHNMAEVRKDLPKDLVLVAWRYDGRNTDFPDITALHNEGFPIVGAPWNEPNNVENLTNFCHEKVDALGMIQTIWCGYNGNRIVTHNGFGQLVPYVRTGVWSWNSNRSVNKYNPEKTICDLMASWRDSDATPGDAKLVDISLVTNLKLDAASNPFLANDNLGMDKLPAGNVQVGRMMFNLPERDGVPSAIALKSRLNPLFPASVELPLNLTADELYVLLGAVDIAPQRFAELGKMEVTFADGSTVVQPLTYTWQIGAVDDVFNFYQNTGNVREWSDKNRTYRNWFYTFKVPEDKKQPIKTVKFIANNDNFSCYIFGLSAK